MSLAIFEKRNSPPELIRDAEKINRKIIALKLQRDYYSNIPHQEFVKGKFREFEAERILLEKRNGRLVERFSKNLVIQEEERAKFTRLFESNKKELQGFWLSYFRCK